MTSAPISRYPVPRLDDLPEEVRAHILEVQEKAGFVPNVFLALAHRPPEFRAFFAYHDALMLKDGGLSKAEREMIVVATSGANDCVYCIVAHGAILRVYAKHPQVAEQDGVNYRKADITPRQRAMLAFALKVSETKGLAKEAYLEELIVRRELSMNFVFYNGRYDSFEGAIPAWAQKTLKAHLRDKRPYLYGRG